MVVCPSCGSSRIRNGYKPAPFWLRVIGMRGLLCDNCNFPFRAFSPLPPKSRRPQHAQRKADVFNSAPVVNLSQVRQKPVLEKHEVNVVTSPMERLELKVTMPSVEKLKFITPSSSAPSSAQVVTDHIAPAHNNLRTEITKINAQSAQGIIEGLPLSTATHEQSAPNSPLQTCPECNSRNL